MSKVIAVVPYIGENEKIFLETIFDKSMSVKPEVLDPVSFPLEEDPAVYFVFFGQQAIDMCKASLPRISYVVLPELSKLNKETGDPEARKSAWNTLLKLKEAVEQSSPILQDETIDLENLPTWLTESLESFLYTLDKKGIARWKVLLKDGRELFITKEPEENKMSITFGELLMLKAVNDILVVEDLSFEYDNKNNDTSSSK